VDEQMFNANSFEELKDTSEVKAAVQYLAKNEVKFRQELSSAGMDYDMIQTEVGVLWVNLLKRCAKFKYSDYIVVSKKAIYGIK